MKDIGRVAFWFTFGAMAYITIEVLYRGYSYPLMGVCGGVAVVFLDLLGRRGICGEEILLKGAAGAALITALELGIGLLSRGGALPVMWDYSSVPLNYRGLICLPFTLVWFLLSAAACVITDMINYYFFGSARLPCYRVLGRVVFRLGGGRSE